ncbi:MAG: aryl-sulfate sulfotransferase [Armatimonadota bacterium]
MKRLSLDALVVGIVFLALVPAHAYQALQGPTELRYWDSARADNGYTLFGVSGTTYLLDMEGRKVHTWPIGTNPHLLDNGNILDALTDDPSGFGGFKEVDWDGNTVWQHSETRTTYHPHHDFIRIFNPKLNAFTTLYIANKDFTQAELIAAGANPATVPSTGGQMDAIVEVDSSGNVVWEWCFFDHTVQNFDSSKTHYVDSGKTIADYPGKLNINLTGHPLKSDWLHCNSLDYNQSLDQIVINSVQGEFYVIDHGGTFIAGNPTSSTALAATSAGDFLYRFGDPARYDQGSPPSVLEDWTQSTTGNKQIGGAHDIQWIAEGLSGAGHFLIFNNAEYLSEHTSQSYVMEIDPYLDTSGNDTGHYVNPPYAGYNTVTSPDVTDKTPKLISKQVVWNYASKSNLTLYSQIGCSAQRLPNGNTLICADTYGYVTEVTTDGQTVWDYIVPNTKNGIVQEIGDSLPMTNSIFRAYRYKASHPALTGRSLTPGNTIAGRSTVSNPYAGSTYTALQRPTEVQYWDPSNAYQGYTLFGAQGATYLIDMHGRLVNTWPLGSNPRLLDSGNLLDSDGASSIKELDWSGATAWQHTETRTTYHPHDDFVRIFNPKLNAYTTLYLAAKDLTSAQCIAAGCDPADVPYDGAQADTIVEVDMSGNIVWEWCFFDHGIQDVDSTKLNYVGTGNTIASYPRKINRTCRAGPCVPDGLAATRSITTRRSIRS